MDFYAQRLQEIQQSYSNPFDDIFLNVIASLKQIQTDQNNTSEQSDNTLPPCKRKWSESSNPSDDIFHNAIASYHMMGMTINNWLVFAGVGTLVLALLVIYYVLLVRTMLDMLRKNANTALLVFAMLGLIPMPPLIILGVLMIIIWALHNRTGTNTSN